MDAPFTAPSLLTTQLAKLGLGLKIGFGASVDIHVTGALVPLRSRCNDASAAAAVAAAVAAEVAAAVAVEEQQLAQLAPLLRPFDALAQ